MILLKATREASSIQIWTYSRPAPRLWIWPVRSPAMRWPIRLNFGQSLSTIVCQAGILMDVHSAVPRIVDVSTTSASAA